MSELSLRQRMTEGVRGRVLSLTQNPIMIKELRSRMRGSRAFVVLTVYLLFMVSLITLIYIPITLSIRAGSGPDLADVGKFVFAMIVLVQIFLVAFMAPAFTAGAISGEKQNQSYDLLRTTLLTPRQLVTGKILSALGYIFLLIFASVPLQSIAFLLGGIALPELLVAALLVLVSAVTFALIGLYFSAVMRTTIGSTVATYAAALFLLIGTPITLLFFTWMNEDVLYSYSFFARSWQAEALLQYGMISLTSLNLPMTMVVSEISLLEHNSYWGFTTSVYGGSVSHSIWLPSPWYLYLFWYTLLAFVFYLACVRRISRIPN